MGTRASARQVLRWTVRNASSTVFRPPQFWKCYPRPLCAGCRLLCSSNSQGPLQSTQHSHEPSPLSRKLLFVDMGFTDAQAQLVYDAVSKIRGGSAANHVLSTLTALFVLGLNPSSVLKVLDKCPELYSVKESLLQQRIGNLWKLGLVEGSLQKVVVQYPQILTLPVKTVNNAVLFLREKCLFTTQQITELLRDSPAIVVENMGQLEYKFQYVYFRMGVKQAEMVKSRLFRYSLDEVRHRHCFLERRGLHQTPDKKGQTSIINPKLNSILNVDEDTFLTQVAKASAEEYDVFKRLMAREWREEELQLGVVEGDGDSDEVEEEEDDDEKTGGKSGYKKRRKK